MRKIKIVIERGNLGQDGSIVDVDGLILPEGKTRILLDFQPDKMVGFCNVYKEEGKVMAELIAEERFMNMYPAIGYYIVSCSSDHEGNKVIDEARLKTVSLSEKPNADPDIKTIAEQIQRDN